MNIGSIDLSGFDLILTYYLTGPPTQKQVRFPRSHRKRIRKKWAGNHSNYATVPGEELGPFIMGRKVLCGPRAMAELILARI